MPSNLILTDFAPDRNWRFADGFKDACGEAPDIHYCVSNWLRSNLLLKIKRYLLYFWFPLTQLKYNGRYDAIIGFQQFYALNMAFFMRLFHIRKKSRLYVMTFIYKDKQGFAGRLYRKYMEFVVNSPYIDRFIVFSSKEVSYYSSLFNCPEDRFVSIRLGVDGNPGYPITKGDYCFSTGRSNRDYAFLCNAFRNLPYRLVIASDTSLLDLPDNVEQDSTLDGDAMLKVMASSFCVILPLKDNEVSSGQLSALQAMNLRKPVIATRTDGISDYVVDGETGLLMDNTPESLRQCLLALKDEDFYNGLTSRALAFAESECSVYSQGRTMAGIVKKQ